MTATAATISWSEQLHQFLNGRLRTTSYRVAVKQHPLVLIPQVPLHTQHIIDGVVLAIQDRGDRCGRESYATVTNHLKSCWGRWLQVMQYVSQNGGGGTDVIDAHLHRRLTYGAMAALQDVLLAWYVVDAVLKVPVGQPPAPQTSSQAIPVVCSLLCEDLPALLLHHMPLLCVTTLTTKSPVVVSALLEYWHRYEDVMGSWYLSSMEAVLQATGVLRRCEEVARRHLWNSHARGGALTSVVQQAGHGAVTTGSGASDLISLIRNVLAGSGVDPSAGASSGAVHVQGGPSSSTALATPGRPTGKALVDVFIQQAFERSRTALSCKQCGALFPSEASLIAHFPTHFATREQRDTDTAVRLRFPSVEDALSHCPFTSRNAGAAASQTVKYFCKTTEAHKPFFQATVVTRKPEVSDEAGKGASGPAKRPRGTEGVVITDIASTYRCTVCQETIRPMQDVFSRDWVLPLCVRVGGGVAHEGCRVA